MKINIEHFNIAKGTVFALGQFVQMRARFTKTIHKDHNNKNKWTVTIHVSTVHLVPSGKK